MVCKIFQKFQTFGKLCLKFKLFCLKNDKNSEGERLKFPHGELLMSFNDK